MFLGGGEISIYELSLNQYVDCSFKALSIFYFEHFQIKIMVNVATQTDDDSISCLIM